MLNAIRKGVSSAFMMVMMGLLVASFAIWGIGDVFRQTKTGNLAVVGSEPISVQTFSGEFQRELHQFKSKLGPSFTAAQAVSMGLGQRVIQNLAARETFWQAATRIGLRIPDSRIADEIKNDDAFKGSLGIFDRFTYESLLRNANMTPHMFEETVRQDMARRDLLQSMTAAATAPDEMVKLLYVYRKETRIAGILTVPASKVTSVGMPDEKTLEAFHRDNAKLFMAPEYRKVTFLLLRPEDRMGEVTITDDQLKEQYQKRENEFSQPERGDIEQIVLPSEAEAKKWYDSIQGGMDFLKAAKESGGFSPADTKLGLLSQKDLTDQINEAAAKAVFALKPGTVSAPVSSKFGWHIFRLLSVQPAKVQPLDQVKDKLTNELKREKAIDMIVKVADKADDQLAGGAALGDIASSLNLKVLTIDAVDRQGNGPDGKPVANLPKIAGILDKVFSVEVNASPILRDAGDGGYYALSVDQITAPVLRPLAKIKDVVVAKWQAEQREQAAKAQATEIAAKIKAGVDLAGFAKATHGEFHDNIGIPREESDATRGIPPEIRKVVFGLTPGQAGIAPAPDGNGYLVMQLKSVLPGDSSKNPADVEVMKEQINTELADDVLVQYQNALNRKYGMEINQGMLAKTLSQLTSGPQ